MQLTFKLLIKYVYVWTGRGKEMEKRVERKYDKANMVKC